MDLSSFQLNLIMYGISLLVAFSPLGEWILSNINKARKPKTKEEIDYLLPLFDEVYSNALTLSPSLSRNMKLKIIDDISINAFAFGKHTIAVTSGSLETLSEGELRGVISHEFGHIANGDTKALLLSTVGNGVFSVVFIVFRLIFKILIFTLALTNTGAYLIPKIMLYILNGIEYIWNYIGQVILSINSRSNEFKADEFAFKSGYGSDLLEALYLIKKINMNKAVPFKEKIRATHPHITDRIGNLEYLIYNN